MLTCPGPLVRAFHESSSFKNSSLFSFTIPIVHTSKMCIASTETGILDWPLTDFHVKLGANKITQVLK